MSDTALLSGIGMMILLIGAWLVTAVPSLFVDGVTLMFIGLGVQYLGVRPMIEAFRADYGPGRHRRSRHRSAR